MVLATDHRHIVGIHALGPDIIVIRLTTAHAAEGTTHHDIAIALNTGSHDRSHRIGETIPGEAGKLIVSLIEEGGVHRAIRIQPGQPQTMGTIH